MRSNSDSSDCALSSADASPQDGSGLRCGRPLRGGGSCCSIWLRSWLSEKSSLASSRETAVSAAVAG